MIGTGLVLTVFVVLVAVSVSYSVHKRAETARIDSLKGLVYGVLGATDIDADAQLNVSSLALPDARLNNASSGLFAELIGSDGSVLWQSKSVTDALPDTVVRPIGDWLFETIEADRKAATQLPMHRLQLSIAWQFDNGEELPFIVHVVDQADSLTRQLKRFDRTLWASLLASALALLAIQLLVLKQSLKPLLDIGQQVADIERGDRDELSDQVPPELSPLSSGLNALLRAERQRHAQYRHLLEDLSHNLKTPLSVLRNLSTRSESDDPLIADTIREQTLLMQTSLERYSKRASIRSPRYLSPTITVRPFIERIIQSLGKLYHSPATAFQLDVPETFSIRMDEADILEVLGNLLENACKYGASTVHISCEENTRSLTIDDDGPGFPEGDLKQYIQRGVRADTATPGTGIGLAASQLLLESYGGSLSLEHSPQGGARVVVHFP